MTADNEQEPLVQRQRHEDDDYESRDAESLKTTMRKEPTPLPKGQLFILCSMRFSEPVSYNLVCPFPNESH